MSDIAKAFAWSSQLPPTERFVLLALADHADHDGGHIDTGLPSIAVKTGYAHRTVQRIVQKLIERGVLRLVDAQPGVASMYQINLAWSMEGVIVDHPRHTITPDTRSPLTHDQGCQTITPDPGSPPSRRSVPMPQTDPPRAQARTRVFHTSSSDLNSSTSLNDDEDGTRAAVFEALRQRLTLTERQATIALNANPKLSLADIDRWLVWLDDNTAKDPMGTMVARLMRGEPVPLVWKKRGAAPARDDSSPFPPRLKLADLIAANQAKEAQHAAATG